MAGYLVVGAGFAGAVYARSLADAGHAVAILDRRDHIGGNAYDFVDRNGVRVHRYGPHLFHTNNEAVVAWLRRFGGWVPYEHRVRARLPDGGHVPLPVNRETVNAVFGTGLASGAEMAAFLRSVSEPVAVARNAAEQLHATIGRRLTDLFFRPYSRKMWGLDLEDLSPAVVNRMPVRFDDDDRYFPDDRFQMLPARGYADLFAAILDHPGIRLSLSTAYEPGMEKAYAHCFNSMPIDEFFGFRLGDLPYRSIRFHSADRDAAAPAGWSVTNYTDGGPYTRETLWHVLPGHRVHLRPAVTVTVEEPCDYRDNGFERYYPVKTADDRHGKLYERYRNLSRSHANVTFIGRCGTYRYLDMHQVVNQSLQGVQRFLGPAA